MGIYELIFACVSVVSFGVAIIFISWLSYKERRELNNRLMCRTVDEYVKVSSDDKPAENSKPISEHRRLVNSFKQKGVNV